MTHTNLDPAGPSRAHVLRGRGPLGCQAAEQGPQTSIEVVEPKELAGAFPGGRLLGFLLNLTQVILRMTAVILNLTAVRSRMIQVMFNLTTVILNLTAVILRMTQVMFNLTAVRSRIFQVMFNLTGVKLRMDRSHPEDVGGCVKG